MAEHLDVPVLHVRLAFVVLSALGGFGVVLYGALWVFVAVAGAGRRPGRAGVGLARRAASAAVGEREVTPVSSSRSARSGSVWCCC